MKSLNFILVCLAASSTLLADWKDNDLTPSIPVIEHSEMRGYQKIPDVAQYKMADWDNVIGVAKGVTLREARRIAEKNPEIDFFFYTKGGQMVLENEQGYRRFTQGDAVFFSGTPWWGSTPGLADGYIKARE